MSSADNAAVLKMILDHPDLQQYLHPEVEGRVPVRIKSNDALGTDVSVEKFGKPVAFVTTAAATEDAPVLDVKAFDVAGDTVTFRIDYAAEGMTAKGELEKTGGQWSFKSFEAVEN
jgi:hypothetical protein